MANSQVPNVHCCNGKLLSPAPVMPVAPPEDGVSEHVQDAMTAVSSFRDWQMTEPRTTSTRGTASVLAVDAQGRRIAYAYSMSCGDGANLRQGTVSNIGYDASGVPRTWDYTVNGQQCRRRS